MRFNICDNFCKAAKHIALPLTLIREPLVGFKHVIVFDVPHHLAMASTGALRSYIMTLHLHLSEGIKPNTLRCSSKLFHTVHCTPVLLASRLEQVLWKICSVSVRWVDSTVKCLKLNEHR